MCTSKVVEGCNDEYSIAQLFANTEKIKVHILVYHLMMLKWEHLLDGGLTKYDTIFTAADP